MHSLIALLACFKLLLVLIYFSFDGLKGFVSTFQKSSTSTEVLLWNASLFALFILGFLSLFFFTFVG